MPAQPDRPVRLTFPAREPGARRIMAGKLQVGVCLQGHTGRWKAVLWAGSGCRNGGCEVRGETVARLRVVLRGRVEEEGPWWTET